MTRTQKAALPNRLCTGEKRKEESAGDFAHPYLAVFPQGEGTGVSGGNGGAGGLTRDQGKELAGDGLTVKNAVEKRISSSMMPCSHRGGVLPGRPYWMAPSISVLW